MRMMIGSAWRPLHGGEIGVETNPGGGSVLWFTVAGVGLTARSLESVR